MIIEITIPSPGESISEVELASWLVQDGEYVNKDQEIAEVESDKATLPLIAEKSGKIKQLVQVGQTVPVGTVACSIDTSAKAPAEKTAPTEPEEIQSKETAKVAATKTEKAIPKTEAKSELRATPLARKMMDEHNLSADDTSTCYAMSWAWIR